MCVFPMKYLQQNKYIIPKMCPTEENVLFEKDLQNITIMLNKNVYYRATYRKIR